MRLNDMCTYRQIDRQTQNFTPEIIKKRKNTLKTSSTTGGSIAKSDHFQASFITKATMIKLFWIEEFII